MLREIIEERKEKAVETLSAGYAKNRLPLEEYERLVEYINKIESERELAVVEKIVAEYSIEKNETQTRKPADYDDEQTWQDREDNYPYHRTGGFPASLTFLSSRTVSGPVKSGSQFVSFLGSQHIKIRKADLAKKKTVLDVVAILGETIISVEEGIRVANRALPILGSAEVSQKVNRQAHDEGPELVISGAALLGGITVKLLRE